MVKFLPASFSYLLFVLVASIISVHCDPSNENADRKVYIVYMGVLPHQDDFFPEALHHNILQDVLEESSVQDSLVRSYKKSFNGFAAKLTKKEMQKLSGMEGIVSVFESQLYQLQTTRSWNFMGFPETVKRNPTGESNIIVGLLDSGIWPESESFSDEGFGPAPKKWKGVCEGGTNFTCNKKLIGARSYSDGSARDTVGHGTHTSSTAAGSGVKGASFFGLAKGTARGAVPSARIAMYKVCGQGGCSSEDILSAFDDAIADGVDVLSVSLGPLAARELDVDPIAIGSFHAMQNGILTSHSAGNSGPYALTSSVAPWMLSVAASSTDRRLIDKLVLGNRTSIAGVSVNTFKLNGTSFPLVYGKQVSSLCDFESARTCAARCVDRNLVEGKFVVCDRYNRAHVVLSAGALGAILVDDERKDFASVSPLPATHLSEEDGEKLKSYINTTKNPKANILKTESRKDSEAPLVVSFSSRGPNRIIPAILKPDISAPGVDILAAFSPLASPSNDKADTRSVKYSVLSGTSMACPHVTGAAAYVKTFHPEWSPSAIKSALMTTAWIMNDTRKGGGEFAYGAGHIDPVKAVNPGLVYEIEKDDYVKMLCSTGYNSTRVKLITSSTCPKGAKGGAKDLNYPSMSAPVNTTLSFKVKFPRTVTNVGFKNSTYKAKITTTGDEIKIDVTPNVLSFKSLGEKKSFVVTVAGAVYAKASASLIWSDGVHSVRSPIIVYDPESFLSLN